MSARPVRRLALLAAALGVLAAPAATGAAPDPAAVDAAVRAWLARERVTAAHVTLLRGNEVVFARGYAAAGAPPDEHAIFPLGSFSKQVTAAAVLALADAGRLRLDAPAAEYLPQWFRDDPRITVRHLLQQTSGLADFLWLEGYRPLGADPATPKSSYVELGLRAPRRYAPGERWSYSNTNYKSLAMIVERVAGRPFDAAVDELVLRPAGITGLGPCHDLDPARLVPGFTLDGRPAPLDASRAAYAGDGGLCGSAAALTAWVRHALAPASGLGARLGEPTRLADGTVVPYGFGLATREFFGHAMRWHGGNVDGHSSMIAWLPDEQLGVIVLTNRGFLWLTEILAPLLGAAPPPEPRRAVAPRPGRYEDGLFTYTIAQQGRRLRVEIDLIGPFEFRPAGPREWVAVDLPASFRLRLPADGARDRFELDWSELRSYARRTGAR